MATRKVLINRHSTKNEAPLASEMFHGEIAVSHPSEVSATTIYTRNGNEMVPFISCAQTISIVSGMIESVDVVYNVEKKTGEPYINVETGGTAHQKVFTLSTSGVASETNLNALSSATVNNFQNMTNILSALTDVVVTAITGDDIINATLSDPSTGSSNTYTLTHKQAPAAIATGFNKLATDAYGHVTAATAVATEDIQALGFKTSAETGEDIEALSASVVTNKTNIEALSAGTQHDIETLSGDVVEYVKVVSGNIETVIDELSANTMAGDAAVFASAKTYTDEAIGALDSEGKVSAAGKYLTGIGIADGKISGITEADLPTLTKVVSGAGNVFTDIEVNDHEIVINKGMTVASDADLQALSGVVGDFSGATDSRINDLSGYTKDVDDKVEALSAGTIQLSADTKATIEQLSAGTIQLSADTYAAINQLSGYAHGEIAQLSGAVQANETDIDNLSAATLNLSAVTLTGVSLNNTPLTVTDHVATVPVADDKDDIANATASGTVADAKAVKDYVNEVLTTGVNYKGATSDVPAGTPKTGDLYIADSAFTVDGKNVEVGDFIIYNGTGWDVIEKNLDGAITGNLTADTVTLGDSANSVKSLANGANGTVLTMVDGTPAWAHDPELTVVSAGSGNVLTDITVNDHEITFTKGVTAASNAELKVLSGAVEDFSGATDAKFTELSAYTKDVDDKVKALSAGTIQLSADTVAYVDAQIDEVYASGVSYTNSAITYAIEGLDSVGSASTTGHYLTSVTITDGKITAVGEVAVPANVAITATTGAAVDTPSAVLTGVTADGTDNHNLTFGMSNKVFSATTADSALTSQSALTSVSATVAADAVHASAATKVDSALTLTDVAGTNNVVFDGSANKTVTFGTATSISGRNSMSMTDAGVVDVDVIDCGEY